MFKVGDQVRVNTPDEPAWHGADGVVVSSTPLEGDWTQYDYEVVGEFGSLMFLEFELEKT